MKKINETTYEAENGCFVVRVSDNKIIGNRVSIKENDSIDNYKDVDYLTAIRAIFSKIKSKK